MESETVPFYCSPSAKREIGSRSQTPSHIRFTIYKALASSQTVPLPPTVIIRCSVPGIFSVPRSSPVVQIMHLSIFSVASALTIFCIISVTSALVPGLSPRHGADILEKRLLCIGDTYNEVFVSVGMGNFSDGAQADIESFCRSWIDIPNETSYYETITPTT